MKFKKKPIVIEALLIAIGFCLLLYATIEVLK